MPASFETCYLHYHLPNCGKTLFWSVLRTGMLPLVLMRERMPHPPASQHYLSSTFTNDRKYLVMMSSFFHVPYCRKSDVELYLTNQHFSSQDTCKQGYSPDPSSYIVSSDLQTVRWLLTVWNTVTHTCSLTSQRGLGCEGVRGVAKVMHTHTHTHTHTVV